MQGMLRMLLGAGLLLCGGLLEETTLPAQEPAFIGGDQAVRFEQAPGFFHYAAMCRTATEFKAQIPPNRLPREMNEPAVCWYVMGSRMRTGGGTKDASPPPDGKLISSEHHVRFIPHDGTLADLYMDLRPHEIAMKREPGQLFATLGTREIQFNFRFSKICPTCARGTPTPAGINPALLEQEFKLVSDSLSNFHSGWLRVYTLSSKIRVEVVAGNQPGGSASQADMRFYGNLNLHLAESCPEPAKSCIGSFATYETCKAIRGESGCGQEPNCSATCAVSIRELQDLQARPCVQLDQQSASLLPDWSQILRQKNPGSIPAKPLPGGPVDIQLTSRSNPPPGVGCSVQASYLRATGAGAATENAARSSPSNSPLAAANSGLASSAKPAVVASAKPGNVSSANPGSLASARSTPSGSPKPNTLSSATGSAATGPKAAAISPAKPGGTSSARSTLPASPKTRGVSSATPGAAATGKSAGLAGVKPSDPNSPKASAAASENPSTRPGAISSAAPAAAAGGQPQKEGRYALKISRETAAGMLLKKVSPAYPLEAKVARVQGTVVLNATISTTGEVSNVDVVSGPPVLQAAAAEAVKQWQYRPFSFNGQPVEVETTIHVVFGEGNAPVSTSAKGHP